MSNEGEKKTLMLGSFEYLPIQTRLFVPLAQRVGCFLKGRKGSWGVGVEQGILTLPGRSELLGMAKLGEQGERVW